MNGSSRFSKWQVGVALLLSVTSSIVWAQSVAAPYTYGTRYDAERRAVGTIAPDPDGSGPLNFAAVRNTYDSDGRLIKVETGELAAWQPDTVAPQSWTGFSVFKSIETTYDASGRKVREQVRTGSAGTIYSLTHYSYDAIGRLLCTAVRMDAAQWASQTDACVAQLTSVSGPDRVTRNVYDAAGQLLKVQRAYGTSLQQDYATYTYSAGGKRTSVTDANGNRASMTYDGFDRQVTWNFPSKTTPGVVSTTDYESYTYDANGNRMSLRKRDGQTIVYAYDALNQVVTKTMPDPSQTVSYSYTMQGEMQTAWLPTTFGVSRWFDAFGRLVRQDDSTTDSTHPGGWDRGQRYSYYDANGNRTAFSFGGQTFLYTYDGLDRMTKVTDGYGTELIRMAYDAQGRRSRVTRVAGGTTRSTSNYTYDPIDRLGTLSHDISGTGYAVFYSFGYNPASQIVTRNVSNNSYAFADYMNRNYSYAANGLNQYTTAGPATISYDANGNLSSDGSVNFSYDTENRLVAASGANTASLLYDPLGHLVRTNNGTAATATWFMYDGDTLIAEMDGSGAMTKRYLHGPGVDEPLAWFDGGSIGVANRHDLFANHQGSIVAVTDGNGVGQAINRYDEYGIASSGAVGRFQYTGQAWIPELGLANYKARMYSPKLGRFMQTDPVGYDDQINLYAYVANDPINSVDPSGETDEDLITVTSCVSCHLASPPPPMPSFSNRGLSAAGSFFRPNLSLIGLYIGNILLNETSDEPDETPETDPDKFKPVKGTKGKEKKETREIYVKDQRHKDHYEVYKNRRDFDKGKRDRDVWADGRPKRKL